MRMQRSSSILGGAMAVLTLILVMIFPLMSAPEASAPSHEPLEPALSSPHLTMLDRQRSALVQIEGGAFFQGTMPEEAEKAAALCQTYGWDCDLTSAEDSYPAHEVAVETFWLETTEVSYGQFISFLNTLGAGGHVNGCNGQRCTTIQSEQESSSILFNGANYTLSNPALEDYPVVDVTWYGAQAYCAALGRRLPTEAEWEYAARGPLGTLYPWGNEWLPEAANVRGAHQAGDGVVIAGPEPVGGYPTYASRDGVRDLAGNVAEWVADWYAVDHYLHFTPGVLFDFGPETGTEKVIRGGSWNDSPFYARAVQRQHLAPFESSNKVGFRCAAD
ncbi:MAG: hypothetical protein OHK0046_15410 [Anaerolineae bacterium]